MMFKEYKEKTRETGTTLEADRPQHKTLLTDMMQEAHVEIVEDRSGYTVTEDGIPVEVFTTYAAAKRLAKELCGYDDR